MGLIKIPGHIVDNQSARKDSPRALSGGRLATLRLETWSWLPKVFLVPRLVLNTLILFKVSKFGRNTFRSLKTTRLSRENLPVAHFTPHSPALSSVFRSWSCEGIPFCMVRRGIPLSVFSRWLNPLLQSVESRSLFWERTTVYPFKLPTHL